MRLKILLVTLCCLTLLSSCSVLGQSEHEDDVEEVETIDKDILESPPVPLETTSQQDELIDEDGTDDDDDYDTASDQPEPAQDDFEDPMPVDTTVNEDTVNVDKIRPRTSKSGNYYLYDDYLSSNLDMDDSNYNWGMFE